MRNLDGNELANFTMPTTSNDDARFEDQRDLSPPKGYESWLEYAVAMFDVRKALGPAFDDIEKVAQRRVQNGIWTDFNALREKAGLSAIEPKGLMASSELPRGKEHAGLRQEDGADASISHDSTQNDPCSLLKLMEAIPLCDGIDFDPVVIAAKNVDFDSER
jgi:hypothetical protein